MEFNWLFVLAVIWMLMNLLGGARKKQQPPRPRPPRPPQPSRTGTPPSRAGTPPLRTGQMDATQQEESRLERMLREFERALEEANQVERPLPLPSAEEVEERESLESEPVIVSLEQEVHREARPRIDLDDEADQIEARRIEAAAGRDRARSRADHAEFDQRIRQEPAEHTATRGYTPEQLRNAVVWREILGPPVSER